jgi:GTP-dependent phosphoenolpyruvate carboxykinase
LRKYKGVEQIVETVGTGIKSPEGLEVGALWLGKRLTETNHNEFATCSSRAGIMITARMSPEATVAMWHDALVTKTKQRKIARHLSSWFGQPITAKEKDVDALAEKAYIKRR